MRIILVVMLASSVALGGCCGYGGPGCGSPWALGLCEPVVQVDVPTPIEIQYGDDTGNHPAQVKVRSISEPTIVGVWPSANTGELTVLGLAVGSSQVELEIAGWEQLALVEFQVTAASPPACEVDPYAEGPGFEIELAAK